MLARRLQSLEELEQEEERERQTEQARPAGSVNAIADPGDVSDFDWPVLGVSDNIDWDAMLAGASAGVGKSSSGGVRHLSND